jgi:hypothetical protein
MTIIVHLVTSCCISQVFVINCFNYCLPTTFNPGRYCDILTCDTFCLLVFAENLMENRRGLVLVDRNMPALTRSVANNVATSLVGVVFMHPENGWCYIDGWSLDSGGPDRFGLLLFFTQTTGVTPGQSIVTSYDRYPAVSDFIAQSPIAPLEMRRAYYGLPVRRYYIRKNPETGIGVRKPYRHRNTTVRSLDDRYHGS